MKQLRIILLACVVLILPGCSNQQKSLTHEVALTADLIKNIKDENLEETIIEHIHIKMNEDFSNQEDVVRNLSNGQRAVYVTWIVEAEVNNGGFNQFYYNSSGQLGDLMQDSFRTIGATQFADLAGQAHLVYNGIKEELEKYNDGTVESFSKSYEGNPLNDFDDKFYKLYESEPLHQIKIKYIRDNVSEFVTE